MSENGNTAVSRASTPRPVTDTPVTAPLRSRHDQFLASSADRPPQRPSSSGRNPNGNFDSPPLPYHRQMTSGSLLTSTHRESSAFVPVVPTRAMHPMMYANEMHPALIPAEIIERERMLDRDRAEPAKGSPTECQAIFLKEIPLI